MAGQSIEAQIRADLNEYAADVQEAVEVAQQKAARWTAKLLRNTSPRRTGDYAGGWTTKHERSGMVSTSTVYNRTRPHLTHLLENGHVSRNKFGTYGRVPAHPHIADAEAQGAAYFEELVRKGLR